MIKVEQLEYAVGSFRLKPLDLEIGEGEYFVLLGPPGSGKSVFIECLCGLKRPLGGRISIRGIEVTQLEPRRRGIGYVPQDYGLFPHLTVEQNIAFGLDRRDRVGEHVTRIVEWLGIRRLLSRRIHGLSGGERQHVALARALVLKPKVLLLDEPVSALDEATRQEVCVELRNLQRSLGITTVHISHNREEAFSVADRAAILRDGALQQVGTMSELSRKPVNEYVARFMRCENILRGSASPGEGRNPIVRIGTIELMVPGLFQGDIIVVIRPERIHLAPCDQGPGTRDANRIPLKVVDVHDRGAYHRVELEDPVSLIAHVPFAALSGLDLHRGDPVQAIIEKDAVHVLQP